MKTLARTELLEIQDYGHVDDAVVQDVAATLLKNPFGLYVRLGADLEELEAFQLNPQTAMKAPEGNYIDSFRELARTMDTHRPDRNLLVVALTASCPYRHLLDEAWSVFRWHWDLAEEAYTLSPQASTVGVGGTVEAEGNTEDALDVIYDRLPKPDILPLPEVHPLFFPSGNLIRITAGAIHSRPVALSESEARERMLIYGVYQPAGFKQ